MSVLLGGGAAAGPASARLTVSGADTPKRRSQHYLVGWSLPTGSRERFPGMPTLPLSGRTLAISVDILVFAGQGKNV